MGRLIPKASKADNHLQSRGKTDAFPPQVIVQDLLCQLRDEELRNPHFALARTRLRNGHFMRAIQDCCLPFNFAARGSKSGRFIKFDHVALCSLRIPATVSSNVVVEDHQNGSCNIHFDVRCIWDGMYCLMRCLTQKVGAFQAKVVRRRRNTSRRGTSLAAKSSPVRQRLAVQVLIRNAERIEDELQQKSIAYAY